ncbi:TolC family protein [Hydrogenobacter thermophilus]|uniref:TolC family protein n=1 Tax=Hydrogenobacter thermophilus TaxID=940 RepID=UPI0030FCDEF7
MIILLLLIGLSYGIDLRTAMEKAVSFYPSLKALEEESKAIEGKTLIYRSYLNPTFGVELGNLGTSKEGVRTNPVYRLSYSQPLLLYPLGTLVGKAVRYEALAFQERIARERNTLKSEVYIAFYSALHKRELLRIAEESYRINEDVYNFVRKLFGLGEVTKLEFFRAERELELARSELEIAKNDYANALKRLSSLIGESVSDVDGSLEDLREIKPLNFEDLPQIRYYTYLIKSVKGNIEVEKTLAKPQLSIEALSEKVSEGSYGFRLGFSATIPLFYRREAEILQLSSQARSLENFKKLELINTKSEYERIMSRYSVLKGEVSKIDNYLLPEARNELSLAIKSYRLRTITALELSDTKRRYIELLRYRSNLLMEAHGEYAKYLLLGGEL